MNILEIAEELQAYLRTHDGNRRTLDAVEESILLLKQDLSEEQRQQEIKRLGDIISFLLDNEESQDTNLIKDDRSKQLFSDKLKRRLEACREECRSMAERKSMEQSPLIQGFEDDFRNRMNVRLNGDQMKEQEHISRLVRDGWKSLNASLRPVVSDFTENAMGEVEACMEKVRKDFAETEVSDCRTSYQEINRTVMSNYDTMQKNILSKANNYEYPSEKFDAFSTNIGVKMEKAAKRQGRLLLLLKLLPALVYLIKYIVDNYLLAKETWFDKLMNILLEKLSAQEDTSAFLQLLEVAIQFIQENEGAFEFTAQFLILFLFVGWLYYIYIKVITNIRKKSFYRKQQAIMQPFTEQFLKELDIRSEIHRILIQMEADVTESYIQKHRILFEKLVTPTEQVAEENQLQKIQFAYLEYIGNGGL